MPDSFARKGGRKPAAPSGARSRSEARGEEERARSQTNLESPADEENLAANQGGAESIDELSPDAALARMNETLRRLHKASPRPHDFGHSQQNKHA
jgi:hypothetical protein